MHFFLGALRVNHFINLDLLHTYSQVQIRELFTRKTVIISFIYEFKQMFWVLKEPS